jgi:uncharacterized protein (DUF3820 family)
MKNIDIGMLHALKWYIKAGIFPGSFGRALILQNREDAILSAHFLTKPHVDTYLEFVREEFPIDAFGTQMKMCYWMRCHGLEDIDWMIRERVSHFILERKLRGVPTFWELDT